MEVKEMNHASSLAFGMAKLVISQATTLVHCCEIWTSDIHAPLRMNSNNSGIAL